MPFPTTGSSPPPAQKASTGAGGSARPVVRAHRETVTRAFLQEQTRKAVAAEMGVSAGTVKSRLKYALNHLRRIPGAEEVGTWLN